MTAPLARVTVRPGEGGVSREPVAFGVPLASGRVRDAALLVATTGDRAWPTDATVLERWPDGSVRWALLDTCLDVPVSGLVIDVRDDVARPAGPTLVVTATPSRVEVRGGRLEIAIDTGRPGLVERCAVADRDVLISDQPPLAIVLANGASAPVCFTAIEVEHQSARRVVLRVGGTAALEGGSRLDVRLRFTIPADAPALGIELGLLNPQAATHPGGFWTLDDPRTVRLHSVMMTGATPAPLVDTTLVCEPGAAGERTAGAVRIEQFASGGEHWNSRVHVNRDGKVTLTRPGYDVSIDDRRLAGRRATPRLVMRDAAGETMIASRLFWEVFPKALEVEPSGRWRVWTLPPADDAHDLQGGERCDFDWWLGFEADPLEVLSWCWSPSTALPAIEDVALVEHLPIAAPVDADARYEALVAAAMDGDDTLLEKRERIDEYGWRHYGDLYADHENGVVPGRRIVSHYNNQYDAVLGLTLQGLRRGDHRWWRQAADLARHVTRTDIYWTTEDRAAFNGGLFWHTAHYTDADTSSHRTYPRDAGLPGGGPSNEHCYAHGLLLHYLLTGDPLSREAVVRLGEWILAMDDGATARFPLNWLSSADTGAASFTFLEGYHGPGRGAANAVVTLLDAYRTTGEPRFVEKAEALVRRVVHPNDDVTQHDLLNVEARWSYTVFLQAIGRYLRVFDARRDARWAYARASLLRYVRWMADHEYFYLDKPEALDFPTETWAAQELRKSEAFDLGAYYAASVEERTRFLERARYFHDRALEALVASPTRTRTRPLVLLMQNGYGRAWFERHTAQAPVLPAPSAEWPPPVRFVPQKQVALGRLKMLAVLAGGLLVVAALVVWLVWP